MRAIHEVDLVHRVLARVPHRGPSVFSGFGRHRRALDEEPYDHKQTVEKIVHATLRELGIEVRPDGSLAMPIAEIEQTEQTEQEEPPNDGC